MSNSILAPKALAKLSRLPPSFEYLSNTDKHTHTKLQTQAQEHFRALATAWQNGCYQTIVEKAETTPLFILCDIRICVYYLYSLWITEKYNSLCDLTLVLTNLLEHPQRPWRAVVDANSDESHWMILNNSISILIHKILRNLDKDNNQDASLLPESNDIHDALVRLKSQLESSDGKLQPNTINALNSALVYFKLLSDTHEEKYYSKQERVKEGKLELSEKSKSL